MIIITLTSFFVIWIPIAQQIKSDLVFGVDLLIRTNGDSRFEVLQYILNDTAKDLIKLLRQSEISPIVITTSFHEPDIDTFSFGALSWFAPIFRFILAIIFVGSFLLKPLIMSPINLLWRRIVESDKPVFTLTFGGAAAFASALSEAAKHL
jgi:hypothetical protein